MVAAHYKKDNLLNCWTRIFPATTRTFTKDAALLEQGRGAAWHVWINARHGRGTAWARHAMCESAFMSVCRCSCLSCPAWKSHLFCVLLCCHLLPVWLYHIFPHYLINGTIFEGNLLNIECILIFSTIFLRSISHSKTPSTRHWHKPIDLHYQSFFTNWRTVG